MVIEGVGEIRGELWLCFWARTMAWIVQAQGCPHEQQGQHSKGAGVRLAGQLLVALGLQDHWKDNEGTHTHTRFMPLWCIKRYAVSFVQSRRLSHIATKSHSRDTRRGICGHNARSCWCAAGNFHKS